MRDNITQLSFLLIYPTMKRPQSAKPGHKGQWGQSSVEEITEITPHQQERKAVRIMKPDLTTHDFARILPRRIQQDKERLYSQGLQLKQALHEVAEENVRLKTKIAVIQREKEKLGRFVETAPEGLGKGSRLQGPQRATDKDNMVVRNLKRLVRQGREENESLRADVQKIKKMMKYTKINELEIQRKMLTDENKRIATMLEQYSSQFLDQQELQRQNEDLRKYLEQEIEEKSQIQEERQKYEEIIDSLEEKLKAEADKHSAKEKKLQRDLQVERRKAQELQRRNDQLYRELKSLRESQQFLEQRQRNQVKPNIRTSKVQKSQKVNTQQSESYQSQKKMAQLKRNNQELSKELQSVKEKLKKAQEASVEQEKSKVNINHSNLHLSQDDFDEDQSPSRFNNHQNENSKTQQDNQEEYEEVFEKEAETEVKENKQSKQQKQIQLLKKDFEENEEQEQLYKKQEKPKKGGKAKKAGKAQGAYKPNKKLLSQIKQLLTYRMKSQRYPFSDIKSDIQSAQTTQFSYSDLCNMLVNEPFYLTADYTRAFLAYCFEKQRVQPSESIPSAVLVGKLRRVIDDFQLMEEGEEKEMIIRIAEMTSTYPRELQVAFENIKNGEETVGRQDLIEMFKKLQLEDKYIDLIIAELSLCSDDLQHLNFHGFFQRFYIEEDGEEYLDNTAIQEQDSEESYKHSSRVRKQPQRGGKEQAEEEQEH